MAMEFAFFLETVISGLMAGVMYALVALGFVLIFKASGIFNFAQGVMCLFAALTFVGVQEKLGLPMWLALPVAAGAMVLLAWLIERLILRHLVNQDPIILFMATIGLAYVLEGLGDVLWGSDVKPLDVGLPQGASDYMLDNFNIYVEKLEVVAAIIASVLVAALAVFFQKTPCRALGQKLTGRHRPGRNRELICHVVRASQRRKHRVYRLRRGNGRRQATAKPDRRAFGIKSHLLPS